MLTTKQLAAKMGNMSTHSVFYAADQFRWKQRENPYDRGFVWDVTDEQIEEYKRIRAARAEPIELRRARVDRVIDLFDLATRGRTFAKRASDIPWTPRPSYVHVPKDDNDEPKEEVVRGVGKGRPRPALYYEVQGTIAELLQDGYYSPKSLREQLLKECPESFSLDDRSYYRYFYEIADGLNIRVPRVHDRNKDVPAYYAFIRGFIVDLRGRSMSDKEIMLRLHLKQKDFNKIMQIA